MQLFSEADQAFMGLALEEAKTAVNLGDYPVGAALVVAGELWGTGRNALFTDGRTVAHAEHSLITKFSRELRQNRFQATILPVTLYTTLEPCLMCLGITVMHRIDRVVVASPDPVGGTGAINGEQLGGFYPNWWPKIEMGLYQEQSCQLIIDFLKKGTLNGWEKLLTPFEQMLASW